MTRTRRIGLVFHHALTVNRDIIRGIRDYALENPHWVLVPILPEASQLASSKTHACDGLICHLFNEEVRQAAARMKKPVVNISGTVTLGFPRVTVDHAKVGRMAAQHLLENGFRRFGFVGYAGYEFSLQREKGFREKGGIHLTQATTRCSAHGHGRPRRTQGRNRLSAYLPAVCGMV